MMMMMMKVKQLPGHPPPAHPPGVVSVLKAQNCVKLSFIM